MISPLGLRDVTLLAAALALVAGVSCALWPSAWPYLVFPAAALWLAVALFFRDPARETPADPRVLVAPADGKVVEISEVREDAFLQRSAHKLAIFMSILDVHVNRAPCEGRIESVTHRAGRFHSALQAQASAENEANLIGIHNTEVRQPVLLKQIAGLVARRVVCAVKPGQSVERGQRIGIVKFGSRAEVFVGSNHEFRWRVRLGDKVKAGVTILGEWL